jgi:hypothetical protein
MGTRSTIALEFADGTVEQVYCHWDGYLAHNGKILSDLYMDPFKVKELVALGGFSSLQETVEETKATAYHHWRGEDLCINKYATVAEYLADCQGEEYDYILRDSAANGGATWFVRCDATDDKWVTLDEAREMEASAQEDW